MTDDKDDVFRQAMGDVKLLDHEKRVPLNIKQEAEPGLARRREAAVTETETATGELSGDYMIPVLPLDDLAYKRPGIQNGVYKNLRLGKYNVDARLDLHGMTVEQSRCEIDRFIKDCVSHDIRCALINHGKGENRKPQPALLKSCVAHWLPQLDSVMAFHSAQKQHGGVGATYILLRKSDKKRRENLEKHKKRR